MHGIVKKFGQYYQRLREDRDQRRNGSPPVSESESDSNLPEARTLPADSHVVYSEHSRANSTPTLMHLVEFIGPADN